jgi:hypothetical protein
MFVALRCFVRDDRPPPLLSQGTTDRVPCILIEGQTNVRRFTVFRKGRQTATPAVARDDRPRPMLDNWFIVAQWSKDITHHFGTTFVMVLSSHAALNKVKASSMQELDYYIKQKLDPTVKAEDLVMKPLGLHFVVKDKVFMGNPHGACCPIRLLLQDGSGQTKLCKVIWRDRTERSKVIRKVKLGVDKFSVICLDDFTVISDELSVEKTSTGYHFYTRNYRVVKKDVGEEEYLRWLS